MRALILGTVLVVLALASGRPQARDDLQAELTGVLEHYYAAQRAGDFDAMMALASQEFRGMMSGVFPHATVEVDGHPHRSDKFKVWAMGLNVIE